VGNERRMANEAAPQTRRTEIAPAAAATTTFGDEREASWSPEDPSTSGERTVGPCAIDGAVQIRIVLGTSLTPKKDTSGDGRLKRMGRMVGGRMAVKNADFGESALRRDGVELRLTILH
jgi:hypothetical protein